MSEPVGPEGSTRRDSHRERRVRLPDGTWAYVGDTVATRHNDKRLVTAAGAAVRNRQSWTVAGIQAGGALALSTVVQEGIESCTLRRWTSPSASSAPT